jgi:hypothetical protein
VDGEDLRRQPIEQRKARPAKQLRRAPSNLALNEHLDGDGPIIFKHACALGCEGTVFRTLRRGPVVGPVSSGPRIERSSFERLQSQEEQMGFVEKPEAAQRFFREGRAGQWKDVLTAAQVRRIVREHGEQMRRFGYLPAD